MRFLLIIFAALPGFQPWIAARANPLTNVDVTVYNERFYRFIGGSIQVETLAEGLGWAEGPVWVESLGALLFSDVAADTIYRWDESGGLDVYLHPSGHIPDGGPVSWRGSNGLAIDQENRLLLAQQGNRTLARMSAPLDSAAPEYEVLANRFEGKKINSPNDLVLHASGAIYFTDPPYGLAGFEQSPDIELDFFGVFRLSTEGELQLVNRALEKPNGIALSSDGLTLYVSNSEPGHEQIIAVELDPRGMPKQSKLFFDARYLSADGPGSTDGMTMHPQGYLFVSLPNGFGILSPAGALLGKVALGQVTNLAFDQTHTYLYITSPARLLRIRINQAP